MFSELALTLFLNNYSPALLKASYYVSQSIYPFTLLALLIAIRKRGIKSGIYCASAIALVYALNFGLKLIFDMPRPESNGIHLIEKKYDASFPSGHAAGSFSAAAISGYNIMYIWAALIAISRLVLGVHFLRDIVAGALLGTVISRLAIKYERQITYAFFGSEHAFEARRKLVHGIFGGAIAAFVYFAPKEFAAAALFISAAAAFAVSRALKGGIRLPVIDAVVSAFERKKDIENFPLKGTLFFLLGASASAAIYDTKIAAASIVILALGDCLSTLVGRPFGKTKYPHNIKKSAEGSLAGLVAAFAGAVVFVPAPIAATGALAGMIIESFNITLFGAEVDDNLSIPIICGAVMTAAISAAI